MTQTTKQIAFAIASLLTLLTGWACAVDNLTTACPHCQQSAGCCMKEVDGYQCKMVEEKKAIKKTVYECREVPYCNHKIKPGCCCPECEDCPRFKKVLVKKEITCGETIITKCVPEKVKCLVPCCNHCGQCVSTTTTTPIANSPAPITGAPNLTPPAPPVVVEDELPPIVAKKK